MPDVNLVIHGRKAAAPGRKPLSSSTPYDSRFGFEGMVTELHPENDTVHVRTPEGRIISNVRVASHVWVTIDKDKGYLSGQRRLPPIDTYVLVFMPNGEYSSAIIIASVFSNDPQHGDFKEDSEDAKEINEGIENSGWKYTEDKRTGTRTLQNKPKDPTIKIEVDQETKGKEKVKVTIHENIITVDPDNGIAIESDKDYSLTVKGRADNTADGELSFKCTRTGLLEIGNAIATLGAMIKKLMEIYRDTGTVGSPYKHRLGPKSTLEIIALLETWVKVFK
jgi:hypothetical protein